MTIDQIYDREIFKHSRGTFKCLNGQNYFHWKNNICRILLAEGLWNLVNGSALAPRIPEEGNSSIEEEITCQQATLDA